MDDYEIITATEASRSFSEVLHRVCYGGESFIIKKGNRLMARIVPVEAVKPEVQAVAEAAEPIPEQHPAEQPVLSAVTGDEAEFYKAWMEQVRKAPVDAE